MDRNSEEFCHFWNYAGGIVILNILPSKIDSNPNKKTKKKNLWELRSMSSFKPTWALSLKQTSEQTNRNKTQRPFLYPLSHQIRRNTRSHTGCRILNGCWKFITNTVQKLLSS